MTRSGVVFCTYSLLIQGGGRVADLGKDGVDLNALLMKPGSRLEQLVSWLGEDKHGPLVVFDECHRAKNLVNENGESFFVFPYGRLVRRRVLCTGVPTKTALAVVALQRAIPNAR